jgi:DNA-binding PucR family transcriptional regulator
MVKSARAVLDGLADLTDEERDILLETFRAWQDNEASADNAAKVLFCHPSTVRQRLRRIEKRTGRSLWRPRDVAELCLALEVHHTLIRPKHAS